MRPFLALLPSLALLGPQSTATVLYGVTATDLVTIDSTTGVSSVVGSLGLTVLPDSPPGALVSAGPLAWHPGDQQLYGLVYDAAFAASGGDPLANINVVNQRLVRIDPASGHATTVAVFGPRATSFAYDALEYLGGAVNSLVISRSLLVGSTSSQELATVTTGGVLTSFRTTAVDNDLLAGGPSPSLLYSLDPNNSVPSDRGRLLDVASAPPSSTPLTGSLPSETTGELAYDLAGNRLYALDYSLGGGSHNLYRLALSGGTALSLEATLTVSGDQVRGIAFATAVPEPRAWPWLAAVFLGSWTLARRRRP